MELRRSGSVLDSLLARLVLLLVLVLVAYLAYRVRTLEAALAPIHEKTIAPAVIVPKGKLSDLEQSTTRMFAKASQAVVHITTLNLQSDPFHLKILEVPRGTGSGFAWDEQGHIVTNLHVIQDAQKARITLPDHSEWPAQLVGVSSRHDLAVLRIVGAAGRLKPLPIGTSHDLLVGQQVAAIGSPFGLDYTLSTGIISGLGREIPGSRDLPIRGAIQTDAAINPGNSGGPLLDSGGRLIGVNAAIYSPSGASAGIGFAIPVDTVARVVPELIRYGHEVKPVLGVELANDVVTYRLGIRGAMIAAVAPGSAAETAGLIGVRRDEKTGQLLVGDVIVKLNEQRITSTRDLHKVLDGLQPGLEVQLTIVRDGKQIQVPLRLGTNVEE